MTRARSGAERNMSQEKIALHSQNARGSENCLITSATAIVMLFRTTAQVTDSARPGRPWGTELRNIKWHLGIRRGFDL